MPRWDDCSYFVDAFIFTCMVSLFYFLYIFIKIIIPFSVAEKFTGVNGDSLGSYLFGVDQRFLYS